MTDADREESCKPDTQTNVDCQRIIIRKKNDKYFKEGIVELFVSESGKLCVTVNEGFDILCVIHQYQDIV